MEGMHIMGEILALFIILWTWHRIDRLESEIRKLRKAAVEMLKALKNID